MKPLFTSAIHTRKFSVFLLSVSLYASIVAAQDKASGVATAGTGNDPRQALLAAKRVMVDSTIWSTEKDQKRLKESLIKWERFQLVDDPTQADLVFRLDQGVTSHGIVGDQVGEFLDIYSGGSMPSEGAKSLWTVQTTKGSFSP